MLHHLSVSEGPGWRIHIIDICQKVCTSTREASWALLKLFLLNPRSLPSPHLSQWEAILFITSDHPSFGPFLSYTHRPKHFAQTLSGNHSNQSLRISPTLLSSTHQSSDDRTIRHFGTPEAFMHRSTFMLTPNRRCGTACRQRQRLPSSS